MTEIQLNKTRRWTTLLFFQFYFLRNLIGGTTGFGGVPVIFMCSVYTRAVRIRSHNKTFVIAFQTRVINTPYSEEDDSERRSVKRTRSFFFLFISNEVRNGLRRKLNWFSKKTAMKGGNSGENRADSHSKVILYQ